MIKLICKQCKKEFSKFPSQVKAGEGKYCSKSCYTKSMVGIDLFKNKKRAKKPQVRVNLNCLYCNKLFETVPSKIGIRKYCSKECYLRAIETVLTNIKQLRESTQYKEWRILVYKRDGFKCQSCGLVGNNLNAHHIVPIAVDPTRIFDINNGITLCKDCHLFTHKDYRPVSKGGELLETLLKGVFTNHFLETISSQALVGTQEKVQRLEGESRTDSNPSTSAVHESDDIV